MTNRAIRGLRLLLAMTILMSTAACTGDTDAADATRAGTFVLGIASAPGNLDPQASALGVTRQLAYFLYETPVVDVDGQIRAGLATSWRQQGHRVVLRIRPHARCDDGTTLTASDVAANIAWVEDVAHRSPLRDRALTAGATATADDFSRTVTITLPSSGFALNGLAELPIVWRRAVTDRAALTSGADGTGPYRLQSGSSGTRYVLARRADSTAPSTAPARVVVSVVPDPSTTANLLLSHQLDAAVVTGPDRLRLEHAGFTPHSNFLMYGELLFDQGAAGLGDETVRRALVGALDLASLRSVLTSGTGRAPQSLSSASPCGSSGLTSIDRSTVDRSALRPLRDRTLTVLYQSAHGAPGAAAAELLVREWNAIGVRAVARAQSDSDLFARVFGGTDWDVLMAPIDGATPAVERGTFSGPAPSAGGSNFAHIDNPDYDNAAHAASLASGTTGCVQWHLAEQALVREADVVPFALLDKQLWTRAGVSVRTTRGYVLPDSTRG